MNVFQASIYVLTLMEFGSFYGINLFPVLITILMNLSDQLVIVICDLDLKG